MHEIVRCQIDADGAKALGEALKENSTLKELYLSTAILSSRRLQQH